MTYVAAHIVTGLERGQLTLQSPTREDVFFQGNVFARENYTDEYSAGITLDESKVQAGNSLAGYTVLNITEAGRLHALKNVRSLNAGNPHPYIHYQPSLLVERPHFMPVNIDLGQSTPNLLAQYTDAATARVVLAYHVRIYIEYEEED